MPSTWLFVWALAASPSHARSPVEKPAPLAPTGGASTDHAASTGQPSRGAEAPAGATAVPTSTGGTSPATGTPSATTGADATSAAAPPAAAPSATPASTPGPTTPSAAPPDATPPVPATTPVPPPDRPDHPFDATVIEAKTFVFETPSPIGNVVRRLYVGEVVRVVEELETNDGRPWARIALGYDRTGFVESARLMPTGKLDVVQYRPNHVLREEMPIGVGFRMGGETMGAGLVLRYQPFSRLGFSASAAGLFADDEGALGLAISPRSLAVRGTVLSAGITSFLVLWNLSPVLELGLSRVAYERGAATLDMTNMYLSAGVEYVFPRGIFVGLAATYVRSLSIDVSYTYGYARDRTVTIPDFGVLGADEDSFQAVEPSVVVGYVF